MSYIDTDVIYNTNNWWGVCAGFHMLFFCLLGKCRDPRFAETQTIPTSLLNQSQPCKTRCRVQLYFQMPLIFKIILLKKAAAAVYP
jgi:hypothetical protein